MAIESFGNLNPDNRSLEGLSSAVRIRKNVPAVALTTFGVGGEIPLLFEASSLVGLQEIVGWINQNQAEPVSRIIGAGSNIVLPDSGFVSPVIQLGREFSDFTLHRSAPEVDLSKLFLGTIVDGADRIDLENHLTENRDSSIRDGDKIYLFAWASCPLMGLSRKISQAGFSGLEFAAGIPGLVGGAVAMNAGAHGQELSNVLRKVYLVSSDGQLRMLDASDLVIGYRSSGLPAGSVVVAVELELVAGAKNEISDERSRCLNYRKKTQPLHLPSAGSVFKNPSHEEIVEANLPEGTVAAAGWLLEKCGMKGRRVGGVAFSELHANWLVRVDEPGRAADVIELIELGREAVKRTFGIALELELKLW